MDRPHGVRFSDESKKNWVRVAALLNLDDWLQALHAAEGLALMFAEEHIKGNKEVIFVTPEFAKIIEDNREFFKALCEEGVVEWLKDFVLSRTK